MGLEKKRCGFCEVNQFKVIRPGRIDQESPNFAIRCHRLVKFAEPAGFYAQVG